jgi:hypothetical protein
MNWLHFLLWVAGIYGLYYLVLLLIDMAGAGRSPTAAGANNELTFSETTQPKVMAHEPEKAVVKTGKTALPKKAEPEVIASGGVMLKSFFSEAMLEKIIYTQQVSF